MTDRKPKPTPAERIAASKRRIAELMAEREQKIAARIIRDTQQRQIQTQRQSGGRS